MTSITSSLLVIGITFAVRKSARCRAATRRLRAVTDHVPCSAMSRGRVRGQEQQDGKEQRLMKAPRWMVVLAVALVAAIAIAVASAGSTRSTKSQAGPYKIALANSFIGNTWRVEMANL